MFGALVWGAQIPGTDANSWRDCAGLVAVESVGPIKLYTNRKRKEIAGQFVARR